ncbi:MAG: hypothetical protein R3A47_00130 [Polyangiales bacterium]
MTKMTKMKLFNIAVFAALALATVGCSKGGPKIDRTQTNLVPKSIFEGEWWVSQTVLDVDADSTGSTFTGDMGWSDFGVDNGQSATVAKIRWVIDENYLYAYRSFELVDGGNVDGESPEFRGQPIAAYPILDHVDIQNAYNPVTGEAENVIEENTTDRRWYERDYMRVAWAKNDIKSFFFVAETNAMGGWNIEDAELLIQDANSHPEFPSSWAPQFVSVGNDDSYRFRDEWRAEAQKIADQKSISLDEAFKEIKDIVHYFSFVTIVNMSPGENCLYWGGPQCEVIRMPMRTAFLRVPPNHQYAAARQTNSEFDKYGLFRTFQKTYAGGGQNSSTLAKYCDRDSDCGTGGYCDMNDHVCDGGLTGDYGETDALAFLRPRHNFFEKSLTDQVCAADWQCDGRFPAVEGVSGSTCDVAAKRCTIPLKDRELRRHCETDANGQETCDVGAVSYILNAGYPKHLVRSAFEVVGNWNEVFMRGWRAARDLPVPNYDAVSFQCQTTDPTAYCFCGSVEEEGGVCKGQYSPFIPPQQWYSEGVAAPYDCYVRNAEFNEPAHPTTYEEYTLPYAYRYEFVGSECMFILKSNTCDWYRTDGATACEDVVDGEDEAVDWEQLGDLRYQFFNYINQPNTPFGGVSMLRVDPTTGELITANANFASGSVEALATRAIEQFPALRCANEELGCAPGEEGADDRYLTGENLRGYFARLGKVEHPVAFSSGRSVYVPDEDATSPDADNGLLVPTNLAASFHETMRRAEPAIQKLHGSEGRAQLLDDRIARLANTSIESQLVASMGVEGDELLFDSFSNDKSIVAVSPSFSIFDDEVLDKVSPFRGNADTRNVTQEYRDDTELSARAYCNFDGGALRSHYCEYWAKRSVVVPSAKRRFAHSSCTRAW